MSLFSFCKVRYFEIRQIFYFCLNFHPLILLSVWFLRAPVTNYPETYSFTVSEVRVWNGGVCRVGSFRSPHERICPCLCELLVVAGHPWWSLLCGCFTPVAASAFTRTPPTPVCVPLSAPLLIRAPVGGCRAHCNLAWPHFNVITFARTLLPNKVTFIGTWS